jgi:glycosyltransferase involved in cell wall biosynthesis
MKERAPLNALMVSNYPSDTGYAWWLMEHFWLTLAELFARRGGRAYVAYPRITTLSPAVQCSSLQAVELTLPWTNREQMHEARQFIDDHDIGFVYLTDRPFHHPQYLALRRFGVRFLTVHDHTPGDRPPSVGVRGALKAMRNRLPWINADRVFAVSELMRERALTNARIPAGRCVTVLNGIRPVRVARDAARRVREELGIDDDTLLVVSTGRAHPYKRPEFVIDCAARLRDRAPELPVCFVLIGDGPSMQALRDQVRRLRLGDTVRLLGFRRDVHAILGASDVALHAALGEAFSLAIVEYMSAGLPVLVPDIASVRQAIRDGETGLVYPRDDIDAAADALLALARDHQARESMGRAARRVADCRYSLERCTAAFRAAVEELITA